MNEYLFLSPDATECKSISADNIYDEVDIVWERSRLSANEFQNFYGEWQVFLKIGDCYCRPKVIKDV